MPNSLDRAIAHHTKAAQPTPDFKEKVRELLGYVQTGTATSITMEQDDATKDFIVTVGNGHNSIRAHYFGKTLDEAVDLAFAARKE